MRGQCHVAMSGRSQCHVAMPGRSQCHLAMSDPLMHSQFHVAAQDLPLRSQCHVAMSGPFMLYQQHVPPTGMPVCSLSHVTMCDPLMLRVTCRRCLPPMLNWHYLSLSFSKLDSTYCTVCLLIRFKLIPYDVEFCTCIKTSTDMILYAAETNIFSICEIWLNKKMTRI